MKKITIPVILQKETCEPIYGTEKSAGADLRANIDKIITMQPMDRIVIPTGVIIELSEGYEGQVRPRSGLAAKKGLTVLNSPGTIDEDYRGEIKVILINLSTEEVTIMPDERIAQLVIAKYEQAIFMPDNIIIPTKRGTGGLGSTGSN